MDDGDNLDDGHAKLLGLSKHSLFFVGTYTTFSFKETRRRIFRPQHYHKNAANLVQKVGKKSLIVFLLHRLNDFEAVTCRLSADKAEKMSRIVFQCI